MKGLFGDIPDAEMLGSLKPARPDRAHAAPVGSGPAGSTCGTCRHLIHVQPGQNVYKKCELVIYTHGYGTDIRCKDLGCRKWEGKA